MNTQRMTRAVVFAIVGAVSLGTAAPSFAAPVLSMTASVKDITPSRVIDVRYYRGGYYHNNGAAVALGILGAAGAVAGAAAYNHGYYGNQGYYGQGYPQTYYGSGPSYGYLGPSYGYYGHANNYGHRNFY